jgi:hypothetical protein
MFFSGKRVPLTGAPPVRRLKNYSSRTGYVYQYYYEGHRAVRDHGTEFVFSVSANRKDWREARVLVSGDAVRAWERSHARELSANERYAVAKMALFQAFDERPSPAHLKDDVRVRAADIEALSESLGL